MPTLCVCAWVCCADWGLITYRETALLANEAISSSSELQRVTVVVAHEIAHQWFGNLVTMEVRVPALHANALTNRGQVMLPILVRVQWWDSLFLNEGDATFWEYYVRVLFHNGTLPHPLASG